ncbi:flagellar hook-basal body complex protein [Clostridium intestinale]|uniref:flagellar hook-basal body complex protein n=1 Tax=Clostridium intestinale TaxID=36845 RepID=UPI003D32DE27
MSAAGISQRVKVSGEIQPYASIGTKAIEGGSDATAPDSVRLVGVQINFEKGEELNGYSFKINEIANGGSTTVIVDTTDKVINISTDLTKVSPEDIMNAINAQLSTTTNPETTAKFDQKLKSVTGVVSPISGTSVTAAGATATTAPTATIQGLNITLPTGTLTDYNISINRVNGPTPATATVTGNSIVINGDFLTPSTTLAADIQAAIAAVLPGSTVTGNGKALTGLDSTDIQGGAKNSKPTDQPAFGMNFTFAEGAALNGYKIQIGKITKGTELSTVVDEKSKTITINGDFTTTPTTLDTGKIQTSINKALDQKAIKQTVYVSGKITTISEAITATEVTGGTPVQSLNADGSVSFVDATKDLKSYDGTLKSLKIPETVVVPGTGQELKVKSYTIDKTGVISAILEDGSVAALGQIAMASFRNSEGLTSLGKNLYEASANSGTATIKSGLETTGEDNSKGYGDNVQGMLEMSNVDLAEQFTDMIVTNRAFQASGKMITTGDEILQDIINLKR